MIDSVGLYTYFKPIEVSKLCSHQWTQIEKKLNIFLLRMFKSQSQDNSIIKESKSGFASQLDNLLSKNDEYTKLQLTIFGITFIVAIL